MTSDHARLVQVTRESTVSVGVARGLIHAAECAGVSRTELLRVAGLTPEQLENLDDRLERAHVYRLVEHAITLAGDPAFGLHWGERHDGYAFDPVAHLIAHAATLRAGLERLVEFHRLLSDESSFQIIERDARVLIRCLNLSGESLRIQRFTAEMAMTGFWKVIRAFSLNALPEQVSFAYPAPSYRGEYTRIFEGVEHFDQPFTGITFDRELMNAASPHNDADMQSMLHSVAERRVLRLNQSTPYAARVREYLVKQGPPCRADMETVARSLGLSARSLRRRLVVEDTTYEHVANEAVAIIAKHLLGAKGLTVQEAAHALGFSHTTTFHRAFKRWTGMTPLGYRAEQLRDAQRE